MIDNLYHLDAAGFALTLPTTYSWLVCGQRLRVPYQAPQGRRVNVIGAYFTHGPDAGHLAYRSWAVLPQSRAKKPPHDAPGARRGTQAYGGCGRPDRRGTPDRLG